MDDCPGGCPGKRVWQEEYVFSVDRYSVFCSDSECLSSFYQLNCFGCCFDLFVTRSVQINELSVVIVQLPYE